MNLIEKKEKMKLLNEEYTITNKSIGYLIDDNDFIRNNPSYDIQKIKEKVEKTVEEKGVFLWGVSLQDKIDTMREQFKKETRELLQLKEEIDLDLLDNYSKGEINVKEIKEVLDVLHFTTTFPIKQIAGLLSISKNNEDFESLFNYGKTYSDTDFEIEILKAIGRDEKVAENFALNNNFNSINEKIANGINADPDGAIKIINEIILDKSIEIGYLNEIISPKNIDYQYLDDLSFRSDFLLDSIQDRIEKRIEQGKGIEDIKNLMLETPILNFVSETELEKFTRNINLLSMETKLENDVDEVIISLVKSHAQKFENDSNKINMSTNFEKEIKELIFLKDEISLLNMAVDYYTFNYDESNVMPEGNVSVERMLLLTNNIFNKTEADEEKKDLMIEGLNKKIENYDNKINEFSNNILEFLKSRENEDIKNLGIHNFLNKLDENNIDDPVINNIIFSQIKNGEDFNFVVNGLNGQHKINLEQSIVINLIKNGYAYDNRKKEGYLDINAPKMLNNLIKEVGNNIFNYCDNFSNGGNIIIDNYNIYNELKKDGLIPNELNESQKRTVSHNLLMEALNEEHDAGSNLRQEKILKTIKSLGVEGKEFKDMFLKIKDNIEKNDLAGNYFLTIMEKELNLKEVSKKQKLKY